nr:DUF2586 domain-containing protein [Candidatus Enterovibrio escacola]
MERHFLFVGTTTKTELQQKLTRIRATSELDEILADDALGKNVKAAQANAGQNWTAEIYGLRATDSWQSAVDTANCTSSFEAVVLTDNITDKSDFAAMQVKAEALTSRLGRWVFFITAVPGISTTQTWALYASATIAFQTSVAANLVVAVPQLNGNNAGVLAGRLCNRAVTIADTPMRVATGTLLGLGAMPKDSASQELSLSTLTTLSSARFSVPQWYADLDGVYWADAETLAPDGDDYRFLEHIRPVNKLNRRIRLKAIRRLGDKILNSTPESIA